MGKVALLALAMILGFFENSLAASGKSPKLARVLPSQVKVSPTSKSSPRNPRSYARPKETESKESHGRSLLANFENNEQLGSRYLTRTVFFWRSSQRLPDSYICDEETRAAKLQEAETQAMDKCFASGEHSCLLQETKILKQGRLDCHDIPGASCERQVYYAGCVAAALVIGSKDQAKSELSF